MASKKIIYIAAIAACVLLVGGVVITIAVSDRTAPVITYEDADITYEEGTDEQILLEGVTATDNKDGDVTDTVTVDSIAPVDDGQNALVTYAARDKHNNIGVATRIVKYVPLSDEASEEQEETGEVAEEASAETDDEAVFNEPDTAAETDQAEENAADAETADSEETEAEEAETEETDVEQAAQTKTDSEASQNEKNETAAAAEQQAAIASAAEAQAQKAAGIPKITLKNNYVEVKLTTYFDPYAYIKSATDDKDNVMARLTVNSNVNTAKAGTYAVTYYCTDTEGNRSPVETLTVKVLGDTVPVN